MPDRAWGHCQHCTYFGSPARMPLSDEEAACQHPALSKYRLLVFGAVNGLADRWIGDSSQASSVMETA